MTGASNKAFDYMAAGIPTRVWIQRGSCRRCSITPGTADYDPANVESIVDALGWLLAHPAERRAMATLARAKIESDWNYDTAFAPVLEALSGA